MPCMNYPAGGKFNGWRNLRFALNYSLLSSCLFCYIQFRFLYLSLHSFSCLFLYYYGPSLHLSSFLFSSISLSLSSLRLSPFPCLISSFLLSFIAFILPLSIVPSSPFLSFCIKFSFVLFSSALPSQ